MSLPLVVLLALLIGNVTGAGRGSASAPPSPTALPAITAAAPPLGDRFAKQCTAVLAKLPPTLDDLSPRVVHPTPDSPFVVAWGEPAVVLRCGVAKPPSLDPTATGFRTINGVDWLPVQQGGAVVWTAVDRAPFVAVTVPDHYEQPPLTVIADAVAVLPRVCALDDYEHPDRLCTRRR